MASLVSLPLEVELTAPYSLYGISCLFISYVED